MGHSLGNVDGMHPKQTNTFRHIEQLLLLISFSMQLVPSLLCCSSATSYRWDNTARKRVFVGPILGQLRTPNHSLLSSPICKQGNRDRMVTTKEWGSNLQEGGGGHWLYSNRDLTHKQPGSRPSFFSGSLRGRGEQLNVNLLELWRCDLSIHIVSCCDSF